MRAALALGLALTFALVGAARGQEHTYDVASDGASRGALTVRREGAALLLTGTLDGRALSLRGEKVGEAWRFVLPPVAGLAGVLSGTEGKPQVLLLRRAPGDVLVGKLEREGEAPVVLRGARRAAPEAAGEAGECRPARDRWWSRHGVAVWEFGRALWDFYKPGSRRFEELRGPVTKDDATRLRLRLARTPGPYTPEVLFREARALARTDREALQLAFGLLVDHPSLPLVQLPGIDADEPVHDKYEHFFASAILAHRSNATGSFTVGWLKEVMDEVSGSSYSEDDLTADALGAEFGQRLQCGAP